MELGLLIIVIGALMLIAEALMPGYFIVVPGTILVIIGGLLIISPGLVTSPLGIILLILITVFVSGITISFYKRLAPGQIPSTTSMDTLVGKKGKVIRDVEPNTIDGKVKIDEQIWSATSDYKISSGENVVVTKTSGVHVFVSKER
ncbi:NfeD family protein [Methanocella sp. CWC-04]|uniref:NfeD family protein n=1 Tax=Methanooceanicella nereidis TaxID=2052831 RepID=A0AAP2RBJ4_9EURY|nr:NfeD family protein [Methanocella sp. CWC-04]MCD1293600.1 NfeD family protein [Methanocella sp. CWC-04]